jgi:L-threonylcarbamoyladenylate synthase
VTVDPPVILRLGRLGPEALGLEHQSTRAPENLGASGAARSPGLLAKHYAPRAPLTLFRGDPTAVMRAMRHEAQRALAQRRRIGVLATSRDAEMLRDLPVSLADLGPDGNTERIAARLYAALRELDAQEVDLILARDPGGDDDLARAIRDRLQRAAAEVIPVG